MGLEAELYHSSNKKQNGVSFSNFTELFTIVNNLHCHLFHSVKSVQQP